MKLSRRLVAIPAAVAVLCLMAGCAIGFSGKRAVSVDLNILGNRLQWTSTVDGTYTPDAAAVESPTAEVAK